MDEFKIAERVLSKVAGRGKEYKEYFDKKLKKWNVSSPADIPEDKKDDFFEEVDAGWKADGEKKEASLMSLRDRRLSKKVEAGCDKLPEGGMRDNCEKKKKEGDGEKDDGKDKKARNAGSYRQFKGKLDKVYSEAQKMLSTNDGDGMALSEDALNRIGKKQFGTAWSVISEALFEAEVYDDFTEN